MSKKSKTLHYTSEETAPKLRESRPSRVRITDKATGTFTEKRMNRHERRKFFATHPRFKVSHKPSVKPNASTEQ